MGLTLNLKLILNVSFMFFFSQFLTITIKHYILLNILKLLIRIRGTPMQHEIYSLKYLKHKSIQIQLKY